MTTTKKITHRERLAWDDIEIPWWVHILPYYKWDVAKRKFDRILLQRELGSVAKEWCDTSVRYEDVEDIFKLIAGRCEWPNALFRPCDDCAVVFWDHGVEMEGTFTLRQLENDLGSGIDLASCYDSDMKGFVREWFFKHTERRERES